METAATNPENSSRRKPVSKVAAYDEFCRKLLDGELRPGQFVTQAELAHIANVSVAAAREAIQKLEHQSILKVHPQRGIQIVEITLEFIRNAFGLRRMLECESVRHFARDASEKSVQEIRLETQAAIDEAQNNPTEEILERAIEIDWALHDQIIGEMNNQMINEIFKINTLRLRMINTRIQPTPTRVADALKEHMRILDHCLARDAAGAALAMEDHISTSMTCAISAA